MALFIFSNTPLASTGREKPIVRARRKLSGFVSLWTSVGSHVVFAGSRRLLYHLRSTLVYAGPVNDDMFIRPHHDQNTIFASPLALGSLKCIEFRESVLRLQL